MKYYDELARYEREGFDVIVEKTWEDIALRDCFDDSCYDIRDMEIKVDNGLLDWFMLRVTVAVRGRALAEEYLGGCLYEDAREVLRDGTAEDLICVALERAREEARVLREFLASLVDNRSVPVV